MNEYQSHRQCQTCFQAFASPTALHQHFEDFRSREKSLLAELERCRMHIATSDSMYENNECAGGCPSFNHRFGQIRHLEQHSRCNETCPFCFNVFRIVRPFMRHDCKASRTESGTIYLQERTTSLARRVQAQLDEQHARPNKRRKLDVPTGSSDSQNPTDTVPTAIPIDQFGNASNETGSSLCFDSISNVEDVPSFGNIGEARHAEFSSLEVDGEYAFAPIGSELLSFVDTAEVGEWAYSQQQFPPC